MDFSSCAIWDGFYKSNPICGSFVVHIYHIHSNFIYKNLENCGVFLNQVHRPQAHTRFLKIVSLQTSVCVCVFVCVSASEAINN